MGHHRMVTMALVLYVTLHILPCFKWTAAKECTNTPTQLSHTLRFASLSPIRSINSSSNSLPMQTTIRFHKPDPIFNNTISRSASTPSTKVLQSAGPFLEDIPLNHVTLSSNSRQGTAQETNLKYLAMLDVDNLVWSFRKTAGIGTKGVPYGGWESPDSELRGHFVGHYMSATALMWASTYNEILHKKMNAVVAALYECQQALGTGYLSAFPSEFFDRFEQIQPVWAPYYTIHKIMAGLLDQYTFAGNNRTLTMAVNMASYFYKRVMRVIRIYTIERHWLSLNEETGGMNDVLYRLYTLTGDRRHLRLAHLFDKPCFLGILAVQADSLSGFHANTHIPVVVGAQMRYEITSEKTYKDLGTFFMDTINSSHSYATGGTSESEFWTDPHRLGDTISTTETEESCTTYNMLKIVRHLFRWTKEMRYADYYERALTNGVLSIQRGQEPGVMIYMLPLGNGYSKAVSYHGWGTRFDSFWCCYGTGIESFSKLGDSIYFQEGGPIPGLYIIQFVSSTVNWDATRLILNQTVNDPSSSDPYMYISIDFSTYQQATAQGAAATNATIHVRIPFWTSSSGCKGMLNEENLQIPLPGEFWSITRVWLPGDKLELVFPVTLRSELIRDDRSEYATLHAFLFGPYLLAGLSSGQWLISNVDISSLSDWMTPVPDSYNKQLYSFSQASSSSYLFLSHSQDSVSMQPSPLEGTNEALYSTFRIVDPVAEKLSSLSCLKILLDRDDWQTRGPELASKRSNKIYQLPGITGSLVSFELFDQPGVYLVHSGVNQSIGFIGSNELQKREEECFDLIHRHKQPSGSDAVFKVLPGLSGENGSVSFQAITDPGCFICTQVDTQDANTVDLRCISEVEDSLSFKRGSSFIAGNGLVSYDPISFIAKGAEQQFLLFPLLAYKDQNYTVYFNVSS
eukprot:c19938_g1_i1 orf=460-3195(+)